MKGRTLSMGTGKSPDPAPFSTPTWILGPEGGGHDSAAHPLLLWPAYLGLNLNLKPSHPTSHPPSHSDRPFSGKRIGSSCPPSQRVSRPDSYSRSTSMTTQHQAPDGLVHERPSHTFHWLCSLPGGHPPPGSHPIRWRPWRMHPCPSYGRIIRHLLTGELAAGLIPWELGVTELVTKPGRKASGACHSSCMPVPWNWCSRPRP